MKAKCYRLDYNELGLSTLCVKKDKEIKRLKEEYVMLQNASDKVEEEKDKEIERLNNIINELEKWLDKKEKLTFNSWNKGIHEVQRKLQELKGVDKE